MSFFKNPIDGSHDVLHESESFYRKFDNQMQAIHQRRIVGDKDNQEAEQSEFAAEDEDQELNFADDNVSPEGEENDPVQEKSGS